MLLGAGISFKLERKNFSSILMITACNSMSFRSRCACVNDSPLCEGVCRRRVGSCSTGTHTHTSETLSRQSGRTFFGSPFGVRRKQKKPEIYGERVISLRLYYSFSLVGGSITAECSNIAQQWTRFFAFFRQLIT